MTPDLTEADETGLTEALQSAVLSVVPVTDSDVTADDDVYTAPSAVAPSSSFRDDLDTDNSDAKSGPPKIGDWQKFISRIVIKYGTDIYMNFMLRDIDETTLTPAELSQLAITAEERNVIARPFAELANKSKLARKHGRMIIASADSVETTMILMKWARTVSRIGNRHRPPKPKRGRPAAVPHSHQQTSTERNGAGQANGDIRSSAFPGGAVVIEGFAGS
jgi:hypothetical protein